LQNNQKRKDATAKNAKNSKFKGDHLVAPFATFAFFVVNCFGCGSAALCFAVE
jgi:hypothetical protein